ncbi:unnamed protein product [Darwinula stevensoni]|uniref:Calponin-homology (CH) domain-containing protein n=1 Tax=Darwinula stevensoni TaxID=69355 RepID=A0A7R8X4C8_9CRUS|nr:unnamed protein product [Darwinula stevensoni]CAG0878889.1 unnamed protein product [Darwinula stevensoni]
MDTPGKEEELRISHSGLVARSPEGHAARGMQIKGHEDVWVEIQAHTFRNWVNEQLRPAGLVVQNLETDFADGVKLIALVEALQKKRMKKIPRPMNHHQYLENVQFALNAIEADGIKLVNIGNEDIVNGNLKLILGLIWSLILRYQIGRTKFPPKKLMLAWLQAVLPDCKVTNFTTDWNSGQTLSALLDYCKPGLFPHWRQLDPRDGVENCRRAMELAKREFKIPMVLEPEYLASPYLDELSGMTYISYFLKENSPGYYATLNWAQKQIPNVLLRNFTTDWNDGLGLCSLVRSLGGPIPGYDKLNRDPQNWESNLEKAFAGGEKLGVQPLLKAKEMADPGLTHLGPMAYVARYLWVPARKCPGERLHVTCDVRHIKVNHPVTFKMDFLSPDLDPKEISVEILGPRRKPVDYKLEFSSTGGRGTFIPTQMGMHEIVVKNEGELASGCPINVRVTPDAPEFRGGGIAPCAVGSIVEVLINSNGARGGEIEVLATSPSGKEISCPVHEEKDGGGKGDYMATFQLHEDQGRDRGKGVHMATFQPQEAGEWNISITYEGEHIESSPFSCFVYDPNAVKVLDLEGGGVPGREMSFRVDSRDAGWGETRIDIVHNGRSIPFLESTLEGGDPKLSRVTFVPEQPGKYRVYVYFNGIELKASPFSLRIGDMSKEEKRRSHHRRAADKKITHGSTPPPTTGEEVKTWRQTELESPKPAIHDFHSSSYLSELSWKEDDKRLVSNAYESSASSFSHTKLLGMDEVDAGIHRSPLGSVSSGEDLTLVPVNKVANLLLLASPHLDQVAAKVVGKSPSL